MPRKRVAAQYATWTVPRIREELANRGVALPTSYCSKAGLLARLRASDDARITVPVSTVTPDTISNSQGPQKEDRLQRLEQAMAEMLQQQQVILQQQQQQQQQPAAAPGNPCPPSQLIAAASSDTLDSLTDMRRLAQPLHFTQPLAGTSGRNLGEEPTLSPILNTTARIIPSCRFLLAIMQFTGCICLYLMRVNISMAIVCMTSAANQTLNKSMTSLRHEGIDKDATGFVSVNNHNAADSIQEFEWSHEMRGHILSSFFIGYMVTQIPSSWLADKLTAKWLVFGAMSVTTILTFFSPLAARTSPNALIFIQIIKGFASGGYYPCLMHLWSNWAPPLERGRLVAFSMSGSTIGSVLAFTISGLLCESKFLGGWPAIFHVYGIATAVWLCFWAFLVHEKPSSHPFISQQEREYVQSCLHQDTNTPKPAIPWLSIVTSPCVYAIVAADFTYHWGFYTALTLLPQYMKDVLKFNIKANGFISSLPYILQFLVALLASAVADNLVSTGHIRIVTVRKIMTSCALVVPAILVMAVGFLGEHQWQVAVGLLTLTVGLLGCIRAGHSINQLDIAGRFAGVVVAFSNTIGTMAGVIAPSVASFLTPNGTQSEWQQVFFLCGCMFLFGEIIYMRFASGELQAWAVSSNRQAQQRSKELNSPITSL